MGETSPRLRLMTLNGSLNPRHQMTGCVVSVPPGLAAIGGVTMRGSQPGIVSNRA